MNEVTKLYENAGVKKIIPTVCSSNELYCRECEAHIENAMPYCKNAEYPPFTAEKQIELIKWLAKKGDFDYTVDIAKNTDAYWTIYFDDSRWTAEEFEETLAGLINQLWQDLTEEERKQIKEILE